MWRAAKLLGLACLGLVAACQSVAVDPVPERTEAPIGGPERVFAGPVAAVVPPLQNARLVGPHGRVGPELVFWTYELPTSRQAFLVACAVLPDVDCAARLPRVCPSGTPEVLFSQQDQGEVRSLVCQQIGFVAPGDLSPNCADTQEVQPIEVTLLSCN
jgi:hypothetical protein